MKHSAVGWETRRGGGLVLSMIQNMTKEQEFEGKTWNTHLEKPFSCRKTAVLTYCIICNKF